MHNYGHLSPTVTSPAQTFTEPVSNAEAYSYLRIPESIISDPGQSALLESFIAAARESAEAAQDRDLVAKQYDLTLDYFPPEIELRAPLVSVDLIRYRDCDGECTTLTENTGYIVDTERALVMPPYSQCWPSFTPWPTSAVLVRFTSGMTSTHPFWSGPGRVVKAGMLRMIQDLWTGVEPDGVAERLMSFGSVPRVR